MTQLDQDLTIAEATPAEVAEEYGNETPPPVDEIQPIVVIEAAPRVPTKKRRRSTREIIQGRRYIC